MKLFSIANDLGRVNRSDTLYKTYVNSELSIVYILLLMASVGICTLGLLLGYAPVVIGGMLISPLMWPLMKTAIGIASEKRNYIKEALFLLVISTFLSIFISFSIAYLSPIKFLNNEIVARTNPNLLDIAVALAAGGIAAIAISQPRISESIAGVAIATSLMPPLCVGGIGLALFNLGIFSRGILLFFASAVSIIFIATLTFIALKIKHTPTEGVQKKGVLYTFLLLLLTAIPMFIFLQKYSFKTVAYNDMQDNLEIALRQITPSAHIDNFKASIPSNNKDPILVEADILIPEEMGITYKQQQEIRVYLEQTIKREIDISLRIQKMISITTEKDQVVENTKKKLREGFVAEIAKIDTNLSISSIEVTYNQEESVWKVKSVLRSDPNITFTTTQKDNIEKVLSQKIDGNVSIHLEIIPRILIENGDD